MKEFYKWRGIISSQESAVEEPFKYSLWPSEKSLVCLETFCLKNNPKGKKKPDNSINFGLLGATFFLFRFPSVFSRCCIIEYCGKLGMA